MNERERLAARIYKASHLTGEFLLRSGVMASEYFDKYRFEANPVLLKEIATALLDILPDSFDFLAGLELGGVPLAVMLSQLTGKSVVFVRKEAKTYGTCQLAEGGDFVGKRLLIVEDVVTSGGQIILSTQDLRDRGAIVTDAVCVINREAGGPEKMADVGVALRPLFTKTGTRCRRQRGLLNYLASSSHLISAAATQVGGG